MRFIKKLFGKISFLILATLSIGAIVSAQTQSQSSDKFNDVATQMAKLVTTNADVLRTSTSEPTIDESPRKLEPPPIPEPLAIKRPGKPNELERAYLDAFAILGRQNKCSTFLGGASSISALNELVKHFKLTYMHPSVAVKMSGPITTYQSNLTGVSFRLFAKEELNLDGSFFRTNGLSNPRVPSIGDFQPNTRGARVTVLLHELGHLVQGVDKHWILPDDGDDPVLSRANTSRILDVCERSINEMLKNDH